MPDCCTKENICEKHLRMVWPKIKNYADIEIDFDKFPSWVTNNFLFWNDERIGEDNLLQTISYLGKEGIITELGKKLK